MSVVIEEEVSECPASVLEYVAAITGMPAGRFFCRASGAVRRSTASTFGAPFFALSALAPEILAKPKANIVLGGRVRVMAEEGGRWLTLISRLFQPRCTLAFSICTPGKPAAQRRVKPLLVQPPQRILNRQWTETIASAQQPADALLIYGLVSFDDIWAAATSPQLADAAREGALLWAGATEAELLIVRAILRARNFEVTDPVPFCDVPETPQSMMHGGWWLRARVQAAEPLPLATEQRESFRSCYSGLRTFLDAAESAEQAAAIAAGYGTARDVTVDGQPVDALMVTPVMGIARSSGRIFHGADADALSWRQGAIPKEVMGLMPEDDSARSPSGNRYLRMSWIGRALAGGLQDPLADVEQAALDCLDLTVTDLPVEVTNVPAEAGAGAGGLVETPTPQVAASPTFRRRARLSRGVGITNVLAIAARLGCPGTDPDEAFVLAQREIALWLDKKGFAIDLARTSLVTETPYGEVSIESEGDRLWSMRFDDRSQMSDGAFWRVESTLLRGDATAIGLRVIQVRQAESAPPPKPGVPKVIAAIANNVGLHEAGFPLRSTAWAISESEDVERLLDLLCSRARLQPVIVVSSTSGDSPDASVDRLAARLAGVAHVVRIDGGVATQLIRRLGRNLATFGNAARLYRPGFNREADPFLHPLWTFGELPLASRIVDDLAEEACVIGVQAEDLDERVPSFQEVRNHIAKTRMRVAVQQTQELASSAQEERDRQEAVRREIQALLDIYADDNKDLIEASRKLRAEREVLLQERDAAFDEVRRLKYQISAMRPNAAVDPAVEDPDVGEQYPASWDDLETWVECFGNDRLVLLPQAAKAARESSFQDIPFAYRVLEFLVEHYVPLRTRHPDDEDTRLRYEAAQAELGIELGPVGTAVEDKRYRKEYRRRYSGKEIKLDLHVKRGVGFDPATLFRLYFWYDAVLGRVVVGHLPTHLTNRITHSG